MKITLIALLVLIASCSSTPKEEKVYCAEVFTKDTKEVSTLCMKESQRNKFLYGEPKPKRRHFSKMGNR